jgi:hypothetical protein
VAYSHEAMKVMLSGVVGRAARAPLAVERRIGATMLPAGEASTYSFDRARTYWGNVPRAQGGNPLDSTALASLSDDEFLSIRRLAALRGLGDVVETALVTVPDAANLSFEEPFSLIMSMGVLHHTPHAAHRRSSDISRSTCAQVGSSK